nr:hypothetical protein B0A51_09640 [Rachicladosporium sp. CCFEE 5018]
MSSPYPTAAEIHTLFAYLSTTHGDKFWSRVSPHVDWLVPGSNAASGHYHALADWMAGAAGVLNKAFPEPLQLVVTNVIGGGEQEWAVAELSADTTCKNGLPYHQRYAWVCRFDDKGVIVQAKNQGLQVRAYLDTELVQQALKQNPEMSEMK